MGCCSSDQRQDADLDKTRRCTDKCWLIIFAICWLILSTVAVWSFISGNPSRLIQGYDSFGNICGKKNKKIEGVSWSGMDMRSKSYLFHLNPLNVSYTMKICVSQCADRNLTGDGELAIFYQRTGSSLFRYDYDLNDKEPERYYSKINRYDIMTNRNKDEERGFGPGPKVPVTKQRPLLNRCVGTDRIKLGNSLINNAYSYIKNLEVPQKIVSDIYASWRSIAWTVMFGIGVSLLVTFTIHYLASIVSTVLMVVATLTLVCLTAFSWYVYIDLKYKLNQIPSIEQLDDDLINEKTFMAFSVLLTIITIIILIFTFFMRSRIGLMVALFHETAACLRSMPTLIIQPIWTCAVLLIFLTFWTSIFLAISAAERDVIYNSTTTRFQLKLPARSIIAYNGGNVTFSPTAEQYYLEAVKHEQPPLVRYLWWFLILMLFWSSEFILGCQQMTVASSVASWYFLRDRSTLSCPVGNSIRRIANYHLGSIALGSLLIVLFKIPRLILTYLEYYLKQLKDKYACLNCVLKCCQCFWYCLENFISYINHNAYTIIAIEGTDYCFSAKVAFKTLASNTLRIITINTMGDFIIFLGKCVVTGSATIFGVYMLRHDPTVHYLAVPVIFAATVTYFVAHSMLCVYEMVIDTMFLCFVEDVNKNSNSHEGFFAPEGLLKFAQEDSAELRPGLPTIAQEMNITTQPTNGKGNQEAPDGMPTIGFRYPNLIKESSH